MTAPKWLVLTIVNAVLTVLNVPRLLRARARGPSQSRGAADRRER